MKSSELRQKFLDFFKKNGHKIISSASLIPENDPTVLFTTAGMHPLVPYLLGEKHPSGKRLASSQKCIRTGDIDDVGDDTHLTFFEMLGNWSLGDYWKEEAIKWSFEFLTKELNIPLERLAVSCFAGDENAPKDGESAKIWLSLGVKKERISFLGKEDNWWGPAGKTGPCGPDTEMFYWKLNDKPTPKIFDVKDKNWVEIWNDVFMQYIKDENGKYLEAKQKNVDTGMGLERTLAVLNGKENVYETDLFQPIIDLLKKEPDLNYNEKSIRIFLDHIRASMFVVADGVTPSNIGRGYVLRKLIRRTVLEMSKLNLKDYNISATVVAFSAMYIKFYPELGTFNIGDIVEKEEKKFEMSLEKGLKKIEKFIKDWGANAFGKNYYRDEDIASMAFDLYQENSFTLEMTIDELKKAGMKQINFDNIKKLFDEKFKKHQELSRTASAGMFKGGLSDASEQVTKYHTATHLLLAGLRKVLGSDVYQKGSNITAERLRFDFSYKEKMTSEQIKDVENFVNDIIKEDKPVTCEEMTLEKARELNATGVFESKYGEKVKVYTIGSGENIVSREICGGPHVERTGILGHFKIQKEESSSSGVRRIKAILE